MPCPRRCRGSPGRTDLRHRGRRWLLDCRPVTESRSARLADIAAQADVSEATVSRVLNDRPGVSERHPPGRAHRDRRARLRPADPAQAEVGAARRAWSCPSWSTRSSRRSRRSSRRRWPPRGSRRCCAPRPPAGCTRTTTCRCCSTAGSPGSSSCQRPARRRHLRPGALPGAARARPADRARQRLAGRGRRPVRLQRRRRVDGPRGQPPRAAGPHRDRAGPRARSATPR